MSEHEKKALPGTEAASDGMASMTFGEHLDELRRRLMISLIAVVVVMAFFLFQKDRVMNFVTKPYQSMWTKRFDDWWETRFVPVVQKKRATLPQSYQQDIDLITKHREQLRAWQWEEIAGGVIDMPSTLARFGFKLNPKLISITPLQDFMTFMLAAILCGLAVASPVVLHQLWKFVGAGLYAAERKVVMSYLPASITLFLAGMSFGFLVLVPYALFFLTGMADSDTMLTVRDYFQFLFLLTIALGVVFQLPVVMVALVRVGIATPALYIKYWRHVILAMFVIGAVLTPPDPFTQVMMAGPMILLFFLGMGISVFVHKKKQAIAAGEKK